MTEQVTLEVSEATLRRAREAARQTHRPVESVLADWLESASAAADIYPLDPSATYHVYTPFGAEATAQSLLEMLRTEDDTDTPNNDGNHAVQVHRHRRYADRISAPPVLHAPSRRAGS
jgi:hypothetical protein